MGGGWRGRKFGTVPREAEGPGKAWEEAEGKAAVDLSDSGERDSSCDTSLFSAERLREA